MTKFKIETGVPVPSTRRNHNRVSEALRALHASPSGSSIFFPNLKASQIRPIASRLTMERWYTARIEDGGIRVWRL